MTSRTDPGVRPTGVLARIHEPCDRARSSADREIATATVLFHLVRRAHLEPPEFLRERTVDYVGRASGHSADSALRCRGVLMSYRRGQETSRTKNFPGPGKPTVLSAGPRLLRGSPGVFRRFLWEVTLDRKQYFYPCFRSTETRFGGLRIAIVPEGILRGYRRRRILAAWNPEMKFRALGGRAAHPEIDAFRTGNRGWGSTGLFPRNVGNGDLGPERTTGIGRIDGAFLRRQDHRGRDVVRRYVAAAVLARARSRRLAPIRSCITSADATRL